MVEVSATSRPYGGRLRHWLREPAFSTGIFVVGLLFGTGTVCDAQPAGSYQYLSDPAKVFIDRLTGVGDDDGQLDDAADYNALEESERTTLEAIMHALHAQGLLDLVTAVTAIWGEIQLSTQGMDQFRLSVTLAARAPDRLRKNGYAGSGNPHVKLPNGNRVGWLDAATLRQSGGPPSMQISC